MSEPRWNDVDPVKFNCLTVAFFVAQNVVLYPIDLVKTRLQVLPDASPCLKRSLAVAGGSTVNAVPRTIMSRALSTMAQSNSLTSISAEWSGMRYQFQQAVKARGFRGLYKGFWWFTVPTCASEALYYSSYNIAKHHATLDDNSKWSDLHRRYVQACAPFFAAFVAETVVTPINVPVDIVTQRMMIMPPQPRDRGHLVTKDVFAEEGVRGFFRGTGLHIITNGLASMFWFGSYELSKRALVPVFENNGPETKSIHIIHAISGGVAGVVSSIISNPLDVIKTRLQVMGTPGCAIITTQAQGNQLQKTCSSPKIPLSALTSALRDLYVQEGIRGFARGVLPRMVISVPHSALTLVLYELALSWSVRSPES
eukprot:c16435_g1_i1.p1 GENE.c16435_g1_i1~~c16435_g1_i1.p1  ORF type:complete len:368 (+),score=64.89 c16435_g1_i1:311-1414(+)